MALELIDKQDNFQIVADEIAAILKLEGAAQVAAATAAGKPDPSLWDFRVFQDRSNPWEVFPSATADNSPIVNVWFDSMNNQSGGSSSVSLQKFGGPFNVDVYGYATSKDNPAGGHLPGDALAVEEVKRTVKLVRNILSAGAYTYLGLRGVVSKRQIVSVDMMQPQQDADNVHHVTAARIAFQVDFVEYSPQVQGEPLELVSLQVARAEDGEIVLRSDYDYT